MAELQINVSPSYGEIEKAKQAGKLGIALHGSSSSGKTYSALQWLVVELQKNPGKVLRCFRYDRATCRDSCIADLENILTDQFKIWDPAKWSKSEYIYTLPGGSKIIFTGAQDPAKLKGPRQDYALINEAMEVCKESYDQITARTRVFTIIDFNPALLESWCYNVEKDPDWAYYRSTFRENCGLPEASRKKILSWEPTAKNKANGTADSYMWDVYGNGKIGVREGAIYKNWVETDMWPNRNACERYGFGMDFGFTDPTSLIECALFQGELYLREWINEKDLCIQEHPNDPTLKTVEGRMIELGVPKDVRIYCDNARPEAIAALRASGYQALPCRKGKGSVLDGINRVKSYPIRIYGSSQNLKICFAQYSWKKQTVHNTFTDVPEHHFSHAPDAVRYWAEGELKPTRHNNTNKGGRSKTTKGRRF